MYVVCMHVNMTQMFVQILIELETALLDDEPHWYKLQTHDVSSVPLPKSSPCLQRRALHGDSPTRRLQSMSVSFSHLICTQKNSGQCSALIHYICCMVDELIFMSKTDFHYRSYNYFAFLYVTTSACAVICGFSSLRTVSKHLFLKVLGYKCTLHKYANTNV